MKKKENVLDMKITLRDLRVMCIRYDKEYGNLPESEYEGMEVFNDIMTLIGNTEEIEFEDHMFIDESEVKR